MAGYCQEPVADVVHRRIANALREEILAGVYDDGGNFPSLTKIMERFCISRPSAIKSVAELKKLGLVRTRKGSGTRVSRPTRTIGVAIPGTADSEFFAAVLDGLVFNCQKSGVDLIAGDIFPKEHSLRAREAERLARHFVQKRVNGVIMQPIAFNAEAERINRAMQTPPAARSGGGFPGGPRPPGPRSAGTRTSIISEKNRLRYVKYA